jgi:hypothetical protein
MCRLFVVALVALLGACASIPAIPTDHAGNDAGQAVIGIGAAKGTSFNSYTFFFRRLDGPAASAGPQQRPFGRLEYRQHGGFVTPKRDYDDGAENGVVLLASLPAGRYELYDFEVFLTTGMFEKSFFSKQDFSIPFEVKPGRAVYLGNYQANRVDGKNRLGLPALAGAVFVVESRMPQDLGLVRKRGGQQALVADVQDVTPSVQALASPFFVTRK